MPYSPKSLTAQVARRRSRRDVDSRGSVLCLLSGTPESRSAWRAETRPLQANHPCRQNRKIELDLKRQYMEPRMKPYVSSSQNQHKTGKATLPRKPVLCSVPLARIFVFQRAESVARVGLALSNHDGLRVAVSTVLMHGWSRPGHEKTSAQPGRAEVLG